MLENEFQLEDYILIPDILQELSLKELAHTHYTIYTLYREKSLS